jgi:class 3 adenylate cyclase
LAIERVGRRLTGILAADIAGYSRLMGADEEGTLAQLNACRRELVDPKIASLLAAPMAVRGAQPHAAAHSSAHLHRARRATDLRRRLGLRVDAA